MSFGKLVLPPTYHVVAQKLLSAIEEGPTPNLVATAGTRAEGFVLGLETAHALEAARIEALYILFAKAAERRLIALGGDNVGGG